MDVSARTHTETQTHTNTHTNTTNLVIRKNVMKNWWTGLWTSNENAMRPTNNLGGNVWRFRAFLTALETMNWRKAFKRSLAKLILLVALAFFPLTLAVDFFSLVGIHSMQGWTAAMRHRVKWKRGTNILKHTGKLLRHLLILVILDLKPFSS